jgi:lysophospholipase L1-like esterase
MKFKNVLITICILAVFGVMFIFGTWLDSGDKSFTCVKEGAIRVACIGDSITEGYGIENRHNSYPHQLQMLLGDEYQVLNYGLSGRTLQKDGDLPYTEEIFYTISQDAKPDIVLIMLGTNDARPSNWNASRYEEELEEFVKEYQELDSAPIVYLMTCPPIFRMGLSQTHEILVDEVIPIIERVAEKRGVLTIDIFLALENHEEFFWDGVHPNANGSKIIAETVYSALRK